MANNHGITRLGVTHTSDKTAPRMESPTMPGAWSQQGKQHDDDCDFARRGHKVKWSLFDGKLQRLAKSNDRIKTSSLCGPSRALYMPSLTKKTTRNVLALPPKSCRQEDLEAVYLGQQPLEPQSTDNASPKHASSERISVAEPVWTASDEAVDAFSSDYSSVCSEHSSLYSTDTSLSVPKSEEHLGPQNTGRGIGLNDSSDEPLDESWWRLADEQHAARLALLDKAASDAAESEAVESEEYDADDEACSWHQEARPHESTTARHQTTSPPFSSLLLQQLAGQMGRIDEHDADLKNGANLAWTVATHHIQDAVGASDETDDEGYSSAHVAGEDVMEAEDEAPIAGTVATHTIEDAVLDSGDIDESDCWQVESLLKSNCELVAGLLRKGIKPGDDLLSITESLCAATRSGRLSRRRSAVPSRSTGNGSLSNGSSVATDGTSDHVLSDEGPSFDPQHGTLDLEDADSKSSLIEDETQYLDAAAPASQSEGQRRVHFNAEALRAPESGPVLTMRSPDDRAILIGWGSQVKVEAERDEWEDSSSTGDEMEATARKFAELRDTVGVVEAHAFLMARAFDRIRAREGVSEADGKVWRQRCLEFNGTAHLQSPEVQHEGQEPSDDVAEAEAGPDQPESHRNKLSSLLRRVSHRGARPLTPTGAPRDQRRKHRSLLLRPNSA